MCAQQGEETVKLTEHWGNGKAAEEGSRGGVPQRRKHCDSVLWLGGGGGTLDHGGDGEVMEAAGAAVPWQESSIEAVLQ